MGKNEWNLISFFLKLFLIWLSWKGIIHVLGEESMPLEERMFPIVSKYWEEFNYNTVLIILGPARDLLDILGFEAHHMGRRLWIVGSSGIGMGNYCIGFQLIYYFSMLILISSFTLPKKMYALLAGVLITYILNILRSSSLCLIDLYIPEYMFLAHDHIFNIIVFGTLIGFYVWLNRNKTKMEGQLN